MEEQQRIKFAVVVNQQREYHFPSRTNQKDNKVRKRGGRSWQHLEIDSINVILSLFNSKTSLTCKR